MRTWFVVILLAAVTAAPRYAPAQVCGDGAPSGGEECDDGDRFGGDGCAANCTLETNLPCALVQGSGKTVQASFFSIPTALTGQFDLIVGGKRADKPADPVPFVLRPQNAYLSPAVVAGLGTIVCTGLGEIPEWGPGNAGGGLIDCGSLQLDGINVTATIDSAAAEPIVLAQQSGMGPMGSVSFEIGVTSYSFQDPFSPCVRQSGVGPAQYGADAIPCTADDPAATPAETWFGSSGNATARVLNSNGSAATIEAGATGLPVDCAQLEAGSLNGAKLVAALPALDVPQLGDTASYVTLVCGSTAPLPTPTPKYVSTCVPTSTPTPPAGATATSTVTSTPSASVPTATQTSAVATATVTVPSTGTPTEAVPTAAVTLPPTAVPTATLPPPTATVSAVPTEPTAGPSCTGDCNGNHAVSVEELELAVSIALGETDAALCDSAYGGGPITVDGLVRAVAGSLTECPG